MLHGLGRTALSMAPLAHDLRGAGFQVINQGYPSRRLSLPKLAVFVGKAIEKCDRNTSQVHFVTHSMGAIVLRQYFQQRAQGALPWNFSKLAFGRAVLLGPPNAGSEIVDAWRQRWWYRWINGPAGSALGTGENDAPQQLPALPMQVGVIAGSAATPNWLLPKMPGPNDGKVSVASTHLRGEVDHLSVPVNHTWLMQNHAVRAQVLGFLQQGHFQRPK
jgi:triacylglycerol lipase